MNDNREWTAWIHSEQDQRIKIFVVKAKIKSGKEKNKVSGVKSDKTQLLLSAVLDSKA